MTVALECRELMKLSQCLVFLSFMFSFASPRHVEFSETELPKGGSGKILKRVLRERFWTREARAVS